MLFTLRELVQWIGLTAFEIWMHLCAVLVFSIMAALKYESVMDTSWWMVFAPMFAIDAVDAYFIVIVFIRTVKELELLRPAGMRLVSSLLVVMLVFIFKTLLCQKLSHEKMISCSEIMIPLFILLQIIMFRACQVH
ncbi:hypothetical protein Ahia01_000969600 [Argonauta hians]